MKQYKKYILGTVVMCLIAVSLITSTEKAEAFWSFNKVKKENNTNYTGAVSNTEIDKIKPAPSITVISPNGGETLRGGKVYTIKWKTSGLNKKAPIQIKLDTMTSSTTSEEIDIIQNTPNTGVYKWKVPVNISGVNIFKIIVITGHIGGTDLSDGFFSIVQKGKTNTPPEIKEVSIKNTEGDDSEIQAGDLVSLTTKAFDMDNDDLVWNINWGDGTGVAGACEVDHKQNRKGWKFKAMHIWKEKGVYTINVNVGDCASGTDEVIRSISIRAN